jgi:hypothetical protein
VITVAATVLSSAVAGSRSPYSSFTSGGGDQPIRSVA